MIEGLSLDDQHVYRYKGRVIPGVTRVLDGILRDFSMVSREKLAIAAETGDLVHRATELDVLGDLDEASVDPSITPYITAWRTFRREVNPVFTASEEIVYHPTYNYAGRLDHEVVIRGEDGILDKKTGVDDVIDAVQLSAYLQAKYHREPEVALRKKRWVLSLKRDGTYRLRPYGDHFHVFLAALTCYRFKNGNGG